MQDQEKILEQGKKLASSEAGQELFRLLQRSQPEALQAAMDQASKGNFEAIRQTMSAALASPEVQRLLKQLKG